MRKCNVASPPARAPCRVEMLRKRAGLMKIKCRGMPYSVKSNIIKAIDIYLCRLFDEPVNSGGTFARLRDFGLSP